MLFIICTTNCIFKYRKSSGKAEECLTQACLKLSLAKGYIFEIVYSEVFMQNEQQCKQNSYSMLENTDS